MDESVLNHQKVGELFVVQYYTQMHKDPAQMHRFYQDESSFAHGGHEMGSEEPVIGQKVHVCLIHCLLIVKSVHIHDDLEIKVRSR